MCASVGVSLCASLSFFRVLICPPNCQSNCELAEPLQDSPIPSRTPFATSKAILHHHATIPEELIKSRISFIKELKFSTEPEYNKFLMETCPFIKLI